MDGTGEHYAKWNKLGGEGQIPYDLTFNWNIINKRKKQTKYHQRHELVLIGFSTSLFLLTNLFIYSTNIY